MTTYLSDIADSDLYADMLSAKYIKEQTHPKFPNLVITNYTDSCMWDQVWNEVTMTCRGLIWERNTSEILARPYRKFFNHDQEQAPKWALDAKVHVTDKLDGSLGILYRQPNGDYAIATRGSFASDQAEWGTEVYQGMYEGVFEPDDDLTYLFELIYPENRIVVNYEGLQSLVLLGAVDKATGASVAVEDIAGTWPGLIVPLFHEGETLERVLQAPVRDNAEGLVLWNRDTDERVKIKYEEYKRLHKYLTNTTVKNVWEILSSGEDPKQTFAGAPDEFHDWLKEVLTEFENEFNRIGQAAVSEYNEIVAKLPEEFTRKDFALAAQESDLTSLLFKLYDDQSITSDIWKMLRPHGQTRTVRKVDSDAN